MHQVEHLSAKEAEALLPDLISLLQDTVDGGASVGFLPPLAADTAEAYWRETITEVAQGRRLLLVSREGAEVTGSVQLALVTKQNGRHRAEVQKLVVHTSQRGRGVGRALMSAVEEAGREAGRTLLVLDTEQDSIAEKLYPKCGYTRSGVIPQYALGADGAMITTVVFYKLL